MRHRNTGVRPALCGLAVAVLTLMLAGPAVAPDGASAEQAGSKANRRAPGFVAAGARFSCARLQTGRVRCWGIGEYGQLGYANTGNIGDNERPSSAGPVNLGGNVATP